MCVCLHLRGGVQKNAVWNALNQWIKGNQRLKAWERLHYSKTQTMRVFYGVIFLFFIRLFLCKWVDNLIIKNWAFWAALDRLEKTTTTTYYFHCTHELWYLLLLFWMLLKTINLKYAFCNLFASWTSRVEREQLNSK